jgi:YbbR domain-containing protein
LDSSFLQQLKQYFNKEKIKADKKLVIYAFFVGVATIFWFLNALSKEYTTTVSYPVNYMNFPKEKVLTNELPSQLTLQVKAFGFDLLRYKLSTSFLPISFDVNSFTDSRAEKNNVSKLLLPTRQLKNRISRQLSSEINLLNISPDTLVFRFSKIVRRKVPVRAQLKLGFEKQFMLGDTVQLVPDSVTISGASVLVDTVKEVWTRLLNFPKLDRTMKRNIALKKIDGLEYSNKRITVKIPVEQFTEAEKNVPITVENLPDSLQLRVFPDRIKISYLVGLSKYETIREDQFRAVVDFRETNSTKGNRLKVRIVQMPLDVRNLRFSPQAIEYIIEKREGSPL